MAVAEVERMVSEAKRLLTEKGLLPAEPFNDSEIHRLELERIFARTWVFVGHESEIPQAGDYYVRYIGEDTFIFVRDENGEIQVLFDACTHRGAQVCRAEKGNAAFFRCPYHGWTYKNTGQLVGVPAYREAYKGLDRSQFGLRKAPRVESIHGFVFANLDPEAPSLEEYLSGMAFYFKAIFGMFPEWEVVAEPHRWIVNSNWKVGCENFAGDDYHTLYLHKSMFDLGVIPIPSRENMKGYHIHAGNGHSMSFSMDPDPNAPGPKYFGFPEEIMKLAQLDALDDKTRELLRRARVAVGTIFPNFSFLIFPGSYNPKGGLENFVTVVTVRQWRPRGPNKMELCSWILVPKGTPDDLKLKMYRASMATFSSSGTFEQDDTEPWSSMTRNAGSVFARKAGFTLNYQMGFNGIGLAQEVEDWPWPGKAYYPRYEEGVQRHWWYRWCEYMLNQV